MRILFIANKAYGCIETPTSTLSNTFNLVGADVIVSDSYHPACDSKRDIDWVVCWHENPALMKQAWEVAQKRKARLYYHMEWIIPWRYGVSYYDRDWRHSTAEIDTKEIEKMLDVRKHWMGADLRSCASPLFAQGLTDFFKADSEIFIKYPEPDNFLAAYTFENFKEPDGSSIKKKWDFCTISSLEAHKNIDFIARALVKMDRPITWGLGGVGPVKDKIFETLEGSKVTCVYFGDRMHCHGTQKFERFMEAKLCVHGWNGCQPTEANLVGTYNFSWKDPLMEEMFSEICEMYDDEQEMADALNYALDHLDEYDAKAKDNRKRLLDDELIVKTVEQSTFYIYQKMKAISESAGGK